MTNVYLQLGIERLAEMSEVVVYFKKKIYTGRDPLINGLNRGFLYGETLFTTMRTFKGRYLFLNEHLKRLEKGIQFMYPENDLTVIAQIKVALADCLQASKNWQGLDFRVRIPVYLENSEFAFAQENNELGFFIIAGPLPAITQNALKLCIAKKIKTSGLIPPYVKLGNYTEEIIELREAKKRGFDDVLFLMENERLAECSTSNIFYRVADKIYTPEIVNGVLAGITRKKLIECLAEKSLQVCLGAWDFNDIINADEVWVTNSVSGIRPVKQLEYKKYSMLYADKSWTKKIVDYYKDFCDKDVQL